MKKLDVTHRRDCDRKIYKVPLDLSRLKEEASKAHIESEEAQALYERVQVEGTKQIDAIRSTMAAADKELTAKRRISITADVALRNALKELQTS